MSTATVTSREVDVHPGLSRVSPVPRLGPASTSVGERVPAVVQDTLGRALPNSTMPHRCDCWNSCAMTCVSRRPLWICRFSTIVLSCTIYRNVKKVLTRKSDICVANAGLVVRDSMGNYSILHHSVLVRSVRLVAMVKRGPT